MSKLIVTVQGKEEQVKTCKHEIGGVYKDAGDYYILVSNDDGTVTCVWLDNFRAGVTFNSIAHLDHVEQNDIPVDAELIIYEVQSCLSQA